MSELRFLILEILDQHDDTTFLDDTVIAQRLANVTVRQIQQQLDILETHELVQLARTFGPCYGALITPQGREAVEQALAPSATAPRRIGF